MKLTANFAVAEFERTSVGLPNAMPVEAIRRATALCAAVLEPWRAQVGPLRITSGYRSREVNDALRAKGYSASSTSQHMLGEAADVQPVSRSLIDAWVELVDLVEAGLPVDQAIVYQRATGQGWIHVSHAVDRAPRRELLVQPLSGGYTPWSRWSGPLVVP